MKSFSPRDLYYRGQLKKKKKKKKKNNNNNNINTNNMATFSRQAISTLTKVQCLTYNYEKKVRAETLHMFD